MLSEYLICNHEKISPKVKEEIFLLKTDLLEKLDAPIQLISEINVLVSKDELFREVLIYHVANNYESIVKKKESVALALSFPNGQRMQVTAVCFMAEVISCVIEENDFGVEGSVFVFKNISDILLLLEKCDKERLLDITVKVSA